MNTIIISKSGEMPGKQEIRVAMPTAAFTPETSLTPIYAPMTRMAVFGSFVSDHDLSRSNYPNQLIADAEEKIRAAFKSDAVNIERVKRIDDEPGIMLMGAAYFVCDIPAVDQAIFKLEREAEDGRKAKADIARLEREAEEGRQALRKLIELETGPMKEGTIAMVVLKSLKAHWYGRLVLWMAGRKRK